MANDWLSHKELKIIKGVGKSLGIKGAMENDPVVVNLMSGPITLATDGWTPNIPTTKNGGVWVDSPISDGRQLLSAPLGNVTEKLNLVITSGTYLEVAQALESLGSMVKDCRAFWEGNAQIDPIYIKWWANCAPGPQYALIYNIEIAPTYEQALQPTIRVSITLEREVAWRWEVPPGANSSLWASYLVSGATNIVSQTIQNKSEWVPTGAGLQRTYLSQNFIDITASQVPGDAPALTAIVISGATSSGNRTLADVYIGKTSVNRTGLTRNAALTLNVGDGTASTLVITAGTVNDSVHSNGSAVNYFYGKRTSTGVDANFVTSVGWGNGVGGGLILPNRELYRGTYAVFIRAANQSGTPTLGDMRIRLTIQEDEGNPGDQYKNQVVLGPINPALSSVQGQWPLNYMGIVTIPFDNAVRNISMNNLSFLLEQKVDVVTANRILVALDVILMPVDEGLLQILAGGNSTIAGTAMVMDNTGFRTRNLLQTTGGESITNGNVEVSMEGRGQDIMLTPHLNQRLYFINDIHPASGLDPQATVTSDMGITLGIVPRSYGIRTV